MSKRVTFLTTIDERNKFNYSTQKKVWRLKMTVHFITDEYLGTKSGNLYSFKMFKNV